MQRLAGLVGETPAAILKSFGAYFIQRWLPQMNSDVLALPLSPDHWGPLACPPWPQARGGRLPVLLPQEVPQISDTVTYPFLQSKMLPQPLLDPFQ